MVAIRPATFEDIPVLLTFEQGVISAERPFDETLKPDPIHYYDLHYLIEDADSLLLVASENDALIASGYASIRTAKPYYQFEQYAYLGFMYVLPEYRGQGVNALIITALKEWCQLKDIQELKLQVYPDNLNAIRAYEKLGFTRDLVTLRLHI